MVEKRDEIRAMLRRSLGVTSPPEKIVQEPFEQNDAHLRRLVRVGPGERPDANDLFRYMEDLRYTQIQGSLLVYLLPICLEVWHDDLRGIDQRYAGVVEHFYPVLADRHVFDEQLSAKQTATVSEFMKKTILDEIDDQRGLSYSGAGARPYRWIRALTTYGVLMPDLEHLWTAWWSLDTIGRAVAAIQYGSCLTYSEYENPVFAPWTGSSGGGPPCLWEFAGHLYAHRWLEPNIIFLRSILNLRAIEELLSRATDRLVGQPEHDTAKALLADLPLCNSVVEERCKELPRFLETGQKPNEFFTWSR